MGKIINVNALKKDNFLLFDLLEKFKIDNKLTEGDLWFLLDTYLYIRRMNIGVKMYNLTKKKKENG